MPLKQLVPEEFCLRCDVCCRFLEAHTIWSPLFTESEIKYLVEKDILPPLLFSKPHQTQKINLIAHKDYFICPCFNPADNKCKIYANRPFECVLYPFLLVRKDKKSYLAVDKKCPYIENLSQDEIKFYSEYLKKELKKKANKSFLKNNPELFTPLHPESPAFQNRDECHIKIKSSRKPRLLGGGVMGFTEYPAADLKLLSAFARKPRT